MLRYNSDLVKYTDKKIVDKNTAGRVTASWYVRNEYEVKAAKDTFYSVILKTKTYTGGAGDVIVEGEAADADLSVNGAGDIDASRLKVAGKVSKHAAGLAKIKM